MDLQCIVGKYCFLSTGFVDFYNFYILLPLYCVIYWNVNNKSHKGDNFVISTLICIYTINYYNSLISGTPLYMYIKLYYLLQTFGAIYAITKYTYIKCMGQFLNINEFCCVEYYDYDMQILMAIPLRWN